jgi:hypothetical protein
MRTIAHIILLLATLPVVSDAQTLEASIVTDWETVQYYGSVEETREVIEATVAYADAILDDYFGIPIEITYIDIPASASEDKIAKHTHVDFLLESLFDYRISNENHFYSDTTIMFTKRDLTRGTQNLGGVAYIGSVCKANSISITELTDNGLDGETLAHELAHVLGAVHDGDEPCEDTPSYGYLMTPTLHSGNFHPSQCTIDTIALHTQVFGNCLNEVNLAPTPITPTPTEERGGGGAMDIYFLLMLIAVMLRSPLELIWMSRRQ